MSYDDEAAKEDGAQDYKSEPTLPSIDYFTSRITYDNVVVGSVAPGRVIFDLGWCREAGLGITLRDDPEGRRHRSGVTFET